MTIRDQLVVLAEQGVEHVVVGGQAGVLRQAVEFSHDLDVLIRRTPENAERTQRAVRTITTLEPEVATLLERGFQQYVHPESGEEIDVHLELLGIPDYEAGAANASPVDYLGVRTACLELPALYASKRTDRPRDALHRQAITQRLAALVLAGEIEPDELVLACCLDAPVASTLHERLGALASSTQQPLLQVRLLALGPTLLAPSLLFANPHLSATVRAVMTLEPPQRDKLLGHGARLGALLAKLPLVLPRDGFHVRQRR